MNPNPRRPITAEEIRTYEEDGVVWLPDILDPEWADYLARGINELGQKPPGAGGGFYESWPRRQYPRGRLRFSGSRQMG